MDTLKPDVLIVEDFQAHMELMRALFQLYGCRVTGASTLVQGMDVIYAHLRPARPYTPTVIVMDINLPRGSLDLEGTTLVAQISEDSERGVIMPPWMVGISQDMSPEREKELYLAGAHFVFAKPLTLQMVEMLLNTIKHPPEIARSDTKDFTIARQAVRNAARQTLQVLRAIPSESTLTTVQWSIADVRALLFRPHLLSDEHRAFIAAMGGISAIRAGLRAVYLGNRVELEHLRDEMLQENGASWDWERYIAANEISQTTYYRYLNMILIALTDHLNAMKQP